MSIYYLYPPPPRYPTTSIREHTFHTAAGPAAAPSSRGNPFNPLLHVLHDLRHPSTAANDVRAPHVDIRETAARYYIDVELPGVAAGDYSARWTDHAVLLVEAEVRRRRVPEEEDEEKDEEKDSGDGSSLHRVVSHDGDAASHQQLYVTDSNSDDDDGAATPPPPPPVTQAKKERTQSLSAVLTARPRALLHHAATLPPHPEDAASLPPRPSHHPPQQQHHDEPAPRVRSLARERRVGTFARAFRFHDAVDRDGLRARLEQGVLSLVVPKKERGREGDGAKVGVKAVAVKRRRGEAPAAGDHGDKTGAAPAGNWLHGPHHHHWTLTWGPARNRVVGPRDWSPGLMNSPGFFM